MQQFTTWQSLLIGLLIFLFLSMAMGGSIGLALPSHIVDISLGTVIVVIVALITLMWHFLTPIPCEWEWEWAAIISMLPLLVLWVSWFRRRDFI